MTSKLGNGPFVLGIVYEQNSMMNSVRVYDFTAKSAIIAGKGESFNLLAF